MQILVESRVNSNPKAQLRKGLTLPRACLVRGLFSQVVEDE